MKKIFSLLLVAVAFLPVSAQENETPEFYGNIIWQDDFQNDHDERMGVYSFPGKAEGFKFTPLVQSMNFYANGNGIMDGNDYWFLFTGMDYDYGVYYTQLYHFDMNTWKIVKPLPDVPNNFIANDFTYDYKNKKFYGLCATEKYKVENELCEMDFSNPQVASKGRIHLADIPDSTYMTLSADAEGQLYAISSNGCLVKLDHEANPTFVCDLFKGQLKMCDRVQSATFDIKTGILYWAAQVYDQNNNGKLISALYSIDVNTHEMKKIVDFPLNAQVVSLYVKRQMVSDGAPGEVGEIGKDFEGGSLTGNITFTAPTKTADGKELTGELTYEVKTASKVLKTGTAQAGAQVSAPVTLDAEGEVRFIVACSNAEGRGMEKAYTSYIGFDQTTAPKNVTTKFDADGNVKLTWEKPEATLNGGYADMDALKYDVVCYRLGAPTQTVAENITAREFSQTLSAEKYYKYNFGIIAKNDTHKSETALGDDFAYGPAKDVTEDQPYAEDFNQTQSFNEYTALDLNKDKKVVDLTESVGVAFYYGFWGYSRPYSNNDGRAIFYMSDSDSQCDDWLLTPMLNLKAGQKYDLEFEMWRETDHLNDQADVAFGEGYDPAVYTQVLSTFKPDYLDKENDGKPTVYKTTLAPAKDGRYMVGFHITTLPFKGGSVYLDNVKLSVNKPTGITTVDNSAAAALHDVYTPSGVLVGKGMQSVGRLPKGIYIVNGKKIVKK